MAWYDPGKQVVCIKGSEWSRTQKHGEVFPAFLQTLTVRCVVFINNAHHLMFEEIRNPPVRRDRAGNSCEAAFRVDRFRPVQPLRKSTEKGVQLLKDIAARKREPEGVEA